MHELGWGTRALNAEAEVKRLNQEVGNRDKTIAQLQEDGRLGAFGRVSRCHICGAKPGEPHTPIDGLIS